MELTRTDVAEIMTPRPLIVSLPATVSAEAAAASFRQTGLSRVPIFGANHRWAMARGQESLRLELERRHAKTEAERRAVPAPPPPTFTRRPKPG